MNSVSNFQAQIPDVCYSPPHAENLGDHALYHAFLSGSDLAADHARAVHLVQQHLQRVQHHACELPADPDHLAHWMAAQNAQVGLRYQHYLAERRQGAMPRYFPTKAHALLFLQQIAPTKQVDGAWLYGTLQYSGDQRLHALIHTYLDEIGNGIAAQNHVAIFNKLLADEGILQDEPLPAIYYQQGCIQLALALVAQDYLPEVIGFNFGYEMLPLHLLISSYELREWDIDPFYFSLHLTIDNPDSGHARQALSTIQALLPADPVQRSEYYRRLKNGYRLNQVGIGTEQIIQQIDLNDAVITLLQHKAKHGQYTHSNYCRHAGKTVNEWLSDPREIGSFLAVLTAKGWIKRDTDPVQSRFWHLIHGDTALMFGVFTAAEQQIVYDWIAGSWRPPQPVHPLPTLRLLALPPRTAEHPPHLNADTAWLDAERSLPRALRLALNTHDRAEAFKLLIPYLRAPVHHSPLGLLACQKYVTLFKGHH